MRSPKIILENLQKHSKEENYKYERLYRNLYNEDFYLQALQNIYANKGAMTPGIDGLTLDGYGKERVGRIILRDAQSFLGCEILALMGFLKEKGLLYEYLRYKYKAHACQIEEEELPFS